MSQAEEKSNESEAKPAFVAEHPGDTLDRCANIVAFLKHAVSNDEGDITLGENPAAKQGFFWVADALEDSLRYEGDRAGDRREPVTGSTEAAQ